MSDETNLLADKPQAQTGWVKLFHSSGALVTLPVTCDTRTLECYAVAFRAVSDAVAAGFTVQLPGLEQGEQKQEVGYVLRRSKSNQDKSETPIIDLYLTNEVVKFKVLSVYLNNDESILAFERASGIALSNLKEFPGTAAPERGSNRQSDSFITKVPHPFCVVMEPNPKYDEKEAAAVAARGKGEIYGVPKRRFVRWDSTSAQQPAQPQQNGKPPATPSVDKPTLESWNRRLLAGPSLEVLNAGLKDLSGLDKYTWRECWKMIQQYAAENGLDWDESGKKFVAPKEEIIPY